MVLAATLARTPDVPLPDLSGGRNSAHGGESWPGGEIAYSEASPLGVAPRASHGVARPRPATGA